MFDSASFVFVYFLHAVSYDEANTSETWILLCLYVLYRGRVGLAVKKYDVGVCT